MARMIQVLLCYPMQDIFKDYSSNHANIGRAKNNNFFPEQVLEKQFLQKRYFFSDASVAMQKVKFLAPDKISLESVPDVGKSVNF